MSDSKETTARAQLVLRPQGRDAEGNLVVMVVGVARVRGALADAMEWDEKSPYNDFMLAVEGTDLLGSGPVVVDVGVAPIGRVYVGFGANDILTSGVQPRPGTRIR